MFMIRMWTVGMLALVTAAAEAQDGLRSAALPETTLHSAADDKRDVFRVPSDFYNRPPDPEPSRLFFPQWLPTFVAPGWSFEPYRAPRFPIDAYRPARQTRAEAAPEVLLLPAAPPAPSLPGKPKTFYMIPGCYAGDRPPEAGWLPAGCDMSRLRVVPPQ